jgi:hypothetical protein
VGLKQNGTHCTHSLADDVNLLVENTDTIKKKKKKETVIHAISRLVLK